MRQHHGQGSILTLLRVGRTALSYSDVMRVTGWIRSMITGVPRQMCFTLLVQPEAARVIDIVTKNRFRPDTELGA